MAERAKPRGASRPRQDSRSRRQSREPKKASSKSPGRGSSRHSPTPAGDGRRAPLEGLDAGPILDDLLERVMAECALAAAERQRVPFTVARARDAILFVAEWRFLLRDEGEPERGEDADPEGDGIWSEDEEPQTCTWDSWTPGIVPTVDVSLLSEQVSSEEVSVTAEDGAPSQCPGELPDTVPVLRVLPLSPGQVSHAEPPSQEPSAAAVLVLTVPKPPSPEPPTAPRRPGRGPRLARPPRPRPVPLSPAPLPAKPPGPPARGPQGSRGATAEDGGQVPPPPPSSSSFSLASPPPVQPRRPSRGTGVPRLGARRAVARRVLPEVRVLDMTSEADGARPGASRLRLPPSGSRLLLPGAGRPPKTEPPLCEPWLGSARLAPGVTVRWGGSERRGPAVAGHGEQQESEAVRRAELELKPILPYPECRMEEYE